MNNILIQRSQSILYDRVLSMLDETYSPIIADDESLGEVLSEHKSKISAIVIFELSEASLKVSRIARNERFGDPAIRIVYVGNESSIYPMPYGATRIDELDVETILKILSSRTVFSALIVEDDEALRDATSLTLTKHMKVDTAENGDVGYELATQNCYDIVVLDIMLPGMSGEDLFTHIKDNSPSTAIVIVTAFDTDDREFKFTFNGAAAYVKKPFESNKIFRSQVMEAALQHHDKSEHSRLFHSRNERAESLNRYKDIMSRYL